MIDVNLVVPCQIDTETQKASEALGSKEHVHVTCHQVGFASIAAHPTMFAKIRP